DNSNGEFDAATGSDWTWSTNEITIESTTQTERELSNPDTLYGFDMSDVVGLWHLNEATMTNGANITDSSGNGHNGTVTHNDGGANKATTGYMGGGMSFDGNVDHINFGSAASLDNLPAVSMAMWIKLNSNP